MDGIEHGQRIGEPRHVSRAPLDILAACARMITSEADHLGREIDPGDARAALGEREGPLTTAAAGVKEAGTPAQPKGVPDAIEFSFAVGRQGIDLGPGVPTLGASVPGGA